MVFPNSLFEYRYLNIVGKIKTTYQNHPTVRKLTKNKVTGTEILLDK